MRILIAEDDARLLKSLLHIFKKNQFIVDGVSNGNDALDYALTNNYDGLVLDVMMPGLDGVEVLKLLRKQNIDTPAMFLTAKTEVYQRLKDLMQARTIISQSRFQPRSCLQGYGLC